jgi:hypothetical protein
MLTRVFLFCNYPILSEKGENLDIIDILSNTFNEFERKKAHSTIFSCLEILKKD